MLPVIPVFGLPAAELGLQKQVHDHLQVRHHFHIAIKKKYLIIIVL